jgi:hypothetical protein
MIRRLFNSTKFLLEIALIIGAVVLVYIWNPMNIFGGKAKLQPTANMVSEITQMGQLVTAEYYGEVIASIDEARTDILDQPQIRDQARIAYEQIVAEINDLKSFQGLTLDQKMELGDPEKQLKRRERKTLLHDEVSRNNILDKLYYLGDWGSSEVLDYFDEVLAFLYLSVNNSEELRASLSQNQLKELLYKLYIRESIDPWDEAAFMSAYTQSKLASLPKREAKKQLALIGRGTVKAGFDFRELNPNMYYINEEVGELHFFGLSPKILNADINPWFIPEKGVPGFDILISNRRVNFKDSKKVKEYAVQKLTSNARKAGIVQQAENFGGETLLRLFSLLTGNDLKKVVFHHDEIIQLTQDIAEDRFVNYEEAKLFETHLHKEKAAIDSLKSAVDNRYNNRQLAQKKWGILTKMINELQLYEFEGDGETYHYLSTFFYEIGRDSLIDQHELESLTAIRTKIDNGTLLGDSLSALWANNDTLLIQSHFSSGLSHLINKEIPVGQYEDNKRSLNEWNNQIMVGTRIRNIIHDVDSVKFQEFRPKGDTLLVSLLYPYLYSPENWQSWISNRHTIQKLDKMETINAPESQKTCFWIYHDQFDPENVYQINLSLQSVMNEVLFKEISFPPSFSFNNSSMVFVLDQKQPFNIRDIDLTTIAIEPNHSKEIEAYLIKLVQDHEQYHQKGPVTKANEWFAAKWENKSSLKDKLGW